MLQKAQKETIAENLRIAKQEAVIAENKSVIAENNENIFIIRTTDSIREKLLPLLAAYLGADPQKQIEIRARIQPLADDLKRAEQVIAGIKPLNEENAREKQKNIDTIHKLYALIRQTKVNV